MKAIWELTNDFRETLRKRRQQTIAIYMNNISTENRKKKH